MHPVSVQPPPALRRQDDVTPRPFAPVLDTDGERGSIRRARERRIILPEPVGQWESSPGGHRVKEQNVPAVSNRTANLRGGDFLVRRSFWDSRRRARTASQGLARRPGALHHQPGRDQSVPRAAGRRSARTIHRAVLAAARPHSGHSRKRISQPVLDPGEVRQRAPIRQRGARVEVRPRQVARDLRRARSDRAPAVHRDQIRPDCLARPAALVL